MPELPESPSLVDLVASRLAALTAVCGARRRLVLAVSGGVDSLLLLALVRECSDVPLQVLHIHHGLSPQADHWAEQVRVYCVAHAVPCAVLAVTVERARPSREAAARSARHAALTAQLVPGDALLLAHHRDDQAETLLLRLLRGSGLTGLGAMTESRRLADPATGRPGDIFLWRPLLGVARADIVADARQRGLRWVDDESNADTGHDRNFLRHEVLPLLATRWPAAAGVLARTAPRLAAADALLNAYLDADLAPLLAPGSADTGGRATLDATALGAMAPGKRNALLRRWLLGIGAPLLTEAWLEQLQGLAAARIDSEGVLTVGGWELHRFRGRLVAFPALPPVPAAAAALPDFGGLVLQPAGTGEPGGLALAVPAGAALTVRLRRGGERLRPAGGAGSRPLKKVLQELHVPPWLRARVPLLYVDGELAAVGDYLAAAAFAPGPDRPPTLQLRWPRPVLPVHPSVGAASAAMAANRG